MNTPPRFLAPLYGAIDRLLDEPSRRALVVSCASDVAVPAAKAVAARLQQRSPIPVALAASATKPDASDLASDLLTALAECLDPWREALSRVDDAPAVPDVPSVTEDVAHAEDLAAVAVERAARALWSVAHPLVLALHAEPEVDLAAWRARVARLASGIASPWVKLVVIDDLGAFDDLRAFPVERVGERAYVPGLDDAARVARWFDDDTRRRVRVLRSHPGAARRLSETVPSVVVDEPFIDRSDFCEAVLAAAIRALKVTDPAPLAWRDALYDDRSLEAPEATLAELVERMVTERTVTVLLQPASVRDVTEWVAFARAISAHAASPSVRWCLFDDAEPAVLPAITVEATVESLRFAPSMADLRASMDEATGDAPVEQAARALMVASDAATHRRWSEALARGAEAVAWSERAAVPMMEVAAWGVLSRALRGEGDLDAARRATERSLERAVDSGDASALAQALSDHADVSFHAGALDEAEQGYDGAARAWATAQRAPQRALALEWRAEVRRARGDLGGAARGFDEARRAWEAMEGEGLERVRAQGVAGALGRLARLWRDAGEDARAAALTAQRMEAGPLYEPPERP